MSSAPPPRAWVLTTVAAANTAFAPMALDLYLPGFSQIADDLGVPLGSVQITLSAALLGLGLGQLVYGPVSDRFGRKRPLLIGIAIFVLASIGCALATSLTALIVLRVLQALGGCAGIVISRAMLRDRYAGVALARAMSIVFLAFGLAPVLAPMLGAVIVNQWSWHATFYALAIFGLVVGTLVALYPETLALERRSTFGLRGALGSYRRIATRADFLLPALVGVFGSIGLFSWVASAPAMIMDEFGFSSRSFAIVFGLVSAGIIATSQVNRVMVRRMTVSGSIVVWLAIQAVAAALLVAFAVFGVPPVAYVIVLGASVACVGGINPNSMATALTPFPHAAGGASALMGAMQMTAGALASAVLAGLHLLPSTEVAAMLMVASAFGLLLIVRLRRRPLHAAELVQPAPASVQPDQEIDMEAL